MKELEIQREKNNKRVLAVVIGSAVSLISILHYSTPMHKVTFHTFYREIYVLLVLTSAYFGGLRFGFGTALVVSLIYAPHVYMTWHAQPGVNVGNLFQIPLFLVSAAALGILSDRERERLRELHKARSMATLGRAALGISAEIHDLLVLARSVLARESISPPAQKELRQIMEKLTSLEHALTHVDPRQLPHEREFLEIDTILAEQRAQLNRTAQSHGVTLNVELNAPNAIVYGQKNDISWLIQQLVNNAVDASSPGDTVHIETNTDGNSLQLIIRDDGKGIPEESLDKIFTPFFSTKSRGTGLGLSVCKKIVSDHEGTISVESHQQRGTTFRISLPLAFAQES